ncbi:MAG: single-stranded-DNA-specific exonuclease RecJ [Anaerolineaceae bacterium]|nr:single-stranded-DNA-specific exonuclease RecJ [Anaerolineaceae bacterium]
MSITSKRWLIAPPMPHTLLRQYRQINPIVAQVLYNRGLKEPDAAYKFLYDRDVDTNPFLMKGINQAVARIRHAIKKQESIVVYGDFDADGVTSTALLMQTLRALGAVVKPYIPHRVDEGYGLNSKALLKLARAGVKLVITVDCGIRSVEDVEDGKAAGLDIIITDHHSIGPEIPNALAVINPKQVDCDYPEDMLAGVGVAYKLAQALLRVEGNMRRNALPLNEEDLLDLVAIGTVADLAPLSRLENRALVRRGLQQINLARRPGLRALLDVVDLEAGKVSAMTIGYMLGPRINAAGRLGSAMTAYHLLAAADMKQATRLAEELHELNSQRQDLTRDAQDLIRERIEAEADDDNLLIFAADPHFQPGIVGLVAGRLVEEFYRPAVVMEQGEDESRASCRSIPQFDITQALDQCADLLVRHGGHAQAAGFTVLNKNVPDLMQRLVGLAQQTLAGQELKPTLEIDAEVDTNHVSEHLLEELQHLEPTGYMNAAPVFMMRNAYILEWRLVGRDNRHLKLKVARAGRPPLDAIGFGLGEWAAQLPGHVDLAYQLELNEWNGRRNLQLNVQDIRLSESANGSA